jgi:hypothetical protein
LPALLVVHFGGSGNEPVHGDPKINLAYKTIYLLIKLLKSYIALGLCLSSSLYCKPTNEQETRKEVGGNVAAVRVLQY